VKAAGNQSLDSRVLEATTRKRAAVSLYEPIDLLWLLMARQIVPGCVVPGCRLRYCVYVISLSSLERPGNLGKPIGGVIFLPVYEIGRCFARPRTWIDVNVEDIKSDERRGSSRLFAEPTEPCTMLFYEAAYHPSQS
jgi:hypothetical protein